MDRKAYKFRLYPNKQQEQTLFWTLSRCRELYNAALAERKEAYRMAGKSVSYYEQKRDLPEIKAEIREEYQHLHSQVLQDVLLRLDKAFKAFFRRVKNEENPGYPRFQGHNRYESFTYPQGGYSLDVCEKRATLTLSKIGILKIKLHRKIANQRRDFHHKQANKLVHEHQVIVFEDLQLTNLLRRRSAKQDEDGAYLPNGAAAKGGLNKSLLDNGLGQFVQIVASKAEEAGRQVYFVPPQQTSQICSACGKKGPKKDLSERVHICVHCGIVLDRDTNAAINIHTACKRPTVWARLCRERD